MKWFGFIFFCLFFRVCAVPLSSSAQTLSAPTEARLIDSYPQVGIDHPNPRFAWILHSAFRGQTETAYQIIVTAENPASNGSRIMWDSKEVRSSKQYGISYNGHPLKSTSKYWWKVRTWGNDGKVSVWSKPVCFITGFLLPEQWNKNVRWIRNAGAVSKKVNPVPMFRKQFEISKTVKNAWLYISGLGQFNSYLNGTKIGNHYIDPAWTDYDKSVDYVTFDVSDNLRLGTNTIGVMLGNGFFAHAGMRDFGPMKMVCQLHIIFSDGSSTDIVSDTSWKSRPSPYTSTSFDGTEAYDARLEAPGWDNSNTDTIGWTPAIATDSPKGVLVSQSAPPVIGYKSYQPVRVTHPAKNVLIYDFGQNMDGVFSLKISGPKDSTIKIIPAEDTTAAGRAIKGRTKGITYILNGNNNESFQLGFSTIGFRYLEIQNVSPDGKNDTLPHVNDLTAKFVCTASKEKGVFHASDKRYNRIYDLCLNTLRSNLISVHTDGPQFERLPWQEVTYTLLPSSAYNFNLENLFEKISRDEREAQRNSGLSPDISPNYWANENTIAGNAFDDAPAWGSSIIIIPWQLYMIYGDKKALTDAYASMKLYLKYLKCKETPDGLIKYGLGDWMSPAGTNIGNIEGAIYVYDTKILYQAALALNKFDDTAYYHKEYKRVRDDYNLAYFDAKAKQYKPSTEADQAMPICFGIIPADEEKKVAKALIHIIATPEKVDSQVSYGKAGEFGPILPYHVTTGDIGTTFLWRALGDDDQATLVQKMIMQGTAPSYLYIIDHGFTTIPENWNLANTRSHNHDMYAGIYEWFYKYLGGISPIKPGYQEISLKPAFPQGLDSIRVSTECIRGKITSSWQKTKSETLWQFTVPVNSSAKVYVPVFNISKGSIKEGDKTIWKNGRSVGLQNGLAYDKMITDTVSGEKYLVWIAGRAITSYNGD